MTIGNTEGQDSPIYPNLAEPLRALAIEAHGALHVVWTKHAHTAGYDKAEWGKLASAIGKLVMMADEATRVKTEYEGLPFARWQLAQEPLKDNARLRAELRVLGDRCEALANMYLETP